MFRRSNHSCILLMGLVLAANSVISAQEVGKVGKGNILIEYWWDGGIDENLDSLKNHPDFEKNRPHASEWRQSFDRTDLLWTNYFGARVRGYIIPPQTGDYTFSIYSNQGELYLSENDNPANATMIVDASGSTFFNDWESSQQSGIIELEADRPYYVEALYVNGTGPGVLGIGWTGPHVDDNNPILIDGEHIAPFIRDNESLFKIVAYPPSPEPEFGVLHGETWVSLSWKPGVLAVSHDVYLGDNYEDVYNGTPETFRGNQTEDFFIAGFPGYPYPDGLDPGATYYWRIDEIRGDGTVTKGPVLSLAVRPEPAYEPSPADNGFAGIHIDRNILLGWTSGLDAILHAVYFGDRFTDVEAGTGNTFRTTQSETTYMVGPLEPGKTYYWRIDEFDGKETHKGNVWSFTAKPAVSGPKPANGAVDVELTKVLSWNAGAVAAFHEMYFGTDADAVANATTASPEYKGPKALGEESYDPGRLTLNTTYYWRIDEVNDINTDRVWTGNVWNFTTRAFIVIDDFEGYDAHDNEKEIWYSWHDGLGYVASDPADNYAGNGTGSAAGVETTFSTCEETIVHGGNQSMPMFYDNNKQGFSYYSEVEMTLSDLRNWTVEGIDTLTIWFRGMLDNDAEPLYVAISNSVGAPVVVVHDDPTAAQIDTWTKWVIPLQIFTDQGINLTNVDRIAIGLGTMGNTTVPGGSGKMFFDDIRLENVHIYDIGPIQKEIPLVILANPLLARSTNSSDNSTLYMENATILASEPYRVGSGTDGCDGMPTGTSGAADISLRGYVRDMFTGNVLSEDTLATVTLKPGEGLTDEINSNGSYSIPPWQGTYRVTVTTANNSYQRYSISQFKLCKDTKRDFLLRKRQEPDHSVYRFLSPTGSNEGQYFCTTSSSERDELLFQIGDWRYKGIAFCAEDPNTNGVQPVHRFWSKWKGTYYYTIVQVEMEQLIDEYSVVWELDKEKAFWAYSEYQDGTKPVYHYWSSTLERHFYTIDPNEMGDKPEYTIVEEKPVAWYAYDFAGNP